jgi:hypothetical protein
LIIHSFINDEMNQEKLSITFLAILYRFYFTIQILGKARFPQGIPLGDSPTIQKLTEAAALFVPPLLPPPGRPAHSKSRTNPKVSASFAGHDSLSNWHDLRWSRFPLKLA